MNSVALTCPSCEAVWRQITEEEASGMAILIQCPSCGELATVLEAAAAAWALGHISRDDFFALAGHVAPEDVGQALTALAKIASWWEQRTDDHQTE